MTIQEILLFNFQEDKEKYPILYHVVNDIKNGNIYYTTYRNFNFVQNNYCNFNECKNKIINVTKNEIFSIFNTDFNKAFALYDKPYENSFFKDRFRYNLQYYRILDQKDIEFMKTDLYKKHKKIFNLILGLKIKSFKIEEDYFFNRVSPFYVHYKSPYFIKLSNDEICDSIVNCYNFLQIIKIFSFFFEKELTNKEKKEFELFYEPNLEKNNIKVGEKYHITECYKIKEKLDFQNDQYIDELSVEIMVSYIDENYVYISKLNQRDMGNPFEYYKRVPLDKFYELKPVQIPNN